MRNDGVSLSGGLNERDPGWCADEKWCLVEWRLKESPAGVLAEEVAVAEREPGGWRQGTCLWERRATLGGHLSAARQTPPPACQRVPMVELLSPLCWLCSHPPAAVAATDT